MGILLETILAMVSWVTVTHQMLSQRSGVSTGDFQTSINSL